MPVTSLMRHSVTKLREATRTLLWVVATIDLRPGGPLRSAARPPAGDADENAAPSAPSRCGVFWSTRAAPQQRVFQISRLPKKSLKDLPAGIATVGCESELHRSIRPPVGRLVRCLSHSRRCE